MGVLHCTIAAMDPSSLGGNIGTGHLHIMVAWQAAIRNTIMSLGSHILQRSYMAICCMLVPMSLLGGCSLGSAYPFCIEQVDWLSAGMNDTAQEVTL